MDDKPFQCDSCGSLLPLSRAMTKELAKVADLDIYMLKRAVKSLENEAKLDACYQIGRSVLLPLMKHILDEKEHGRSPKFV